MTVAPRPAVTFRLIAALSRFALSPIEIVGPEKARRELERSSRGPEWLVGACRDLASVCADTVAGVPSRFIAEMKLNEGLVKENPRDALRRLREQLTTQVAAKVADEAAAQAAAKLPSVAQE